MENYRKSASCKINLHLSVGEKRVDGFHNLKSIFFPLEFGDSLTFTPLSENGVCDLRVFWSVKAPAREIPLERNIVYKAVSLFRKRTGWNSGIRIELEKNIPAGSGLGGGSADAAATLKTLDELTGTGLPFSDLCGMAAELGSDVPFFLYNGAAFVSGRGEYVRRLENPAELSIILVIPNFASDTSEAFRLLDEYRVMKNKTPNPVLNEETLVNALQAHPSTWRYYNDFLPVSLKGVHGKEYAEILKELKNAKADFCGLSGSGSCCFGVFTDRNVADNARKILSFGKNFVQITRSAS